MKGRVKWFDSTKGFGFIHTEEGNDLFVHYSSFQNKKYEILEEGEEVEFEVIQGKRGLLASNLKKING
jgi:CspA family cold shock protein